MTFRTTLRNAFLPIALMASAPAAEAEPSFRQELARQCADGSWYAWIPTGAPSYKIYKRSCTPSGIGINFLSCVELGEMKGFWQKDVEKMERKIKNAGNSGFVSSPWAGPLEQILDHMPMEDAQELLRMLRSDLKKINEAMVTANKEPNNAYRCPGMS